MPKGYMDYANGYFVSGMKNKGSIVNYILAKLWNCFINHFYKETDGNEIKMSKWKELIISLPFVVN